MSKQAETFEAVAREHLKNLEDAGETPEQIVIQLTAVASSYAADGFADEAAALLDVVRQYRLKRIRADKRGSGGSIDALPYIGRS